ncbi:MAG TPA: hypothetical protein VF414_17845 [Thermoanaerobaculia bacterium]
MSDKHFALLPFNQTFKVGDVLLREPNGSGVSLPIDKIREEDAPALRGWAKWVVISVAGDQMTVEQVEEPKPQTRGPRTPNRRWPFS